VAKAPSDYHPYIISLADALLGTFPIPDFPEVPVLELSRKILRCYLLDVLTKAVKGGGAKVAKDGRTIHMVDFVFGEATKLTPESSTKVQLDSPEFDPSEVSIIPEVEELTRFSGVEFDE
jgi:hypothetical protein